MALEQQLASVPLLAGLDARIRRRLAETGKRRTYAADEDIVREGSTGTALYIVLSGNARVERGGETLGEVKAGDFFGELALIEEHPRSASVIATARPSACSSRPGSSRPCSGSTRRSPSRS